MKVPRLYLSPAALLAALLLSFACLGAALAAESVAIVTDMKGKATLTINGEKRALKLLAELPAGAEIALEKECQLVIVFLKAGSEFQAGGPATVAIGPSEPRVMAGTTPVRRNSSLTAETVRLDTKGGRLIQGAIGMRDISMRRDVKVIGPTVRMLEFGRSFEWSTVTDEQEFSFALNEEGRAAPLLETRVVGGKFALPESLALVPGKEYSWTIGFDQNNGTRASYTSRFSLASPEEQARFARLKPKAGAQFSERVLYAVLLEQASLHLDAKKQWQALAAERPESSELRQMSTR